VGAGALLAGTGIFAVKLKVYSWKPMDIPWKFPGNRVFLFFFFRNSLEIEVKKAGRIICK